MRRPARIIAALVAVAAFVALSLALARILSANGAERDAIADVLAAQAHGDADGVIARIAGCAERPACVATQRENARRLRAAGELTIVRLDPSTSFSPGGTSGTARVVWKTPRRTTTVQCVGVRRAGDVLGGLTVELTALSRPIPRESSCPGG